MKKILRSHTTLRTVLLFVLAASLLAVGGIGTENLAEFLRAGCCGAGIGGSLCSKKLIAERNGSALSRTAEELIRIYKHEKGD